MKRHLTRYLSVFLLIGLFGGCDGLMAPDMTGGEPATVRFHLTDAPFPFDLVDSTNVTIERVELVSEEEGVVTVSEEEQAFNLLELRDGVTAPLGEVEVSEGTYEQIRFIVNEEAEVVMKDGTTYSLKVPSGTETGIKILTNGLEVDGSTLTDITLDFNVEESFVVQGNPNTPAGINGFIFKPVVKLADVERSPEDEAEETEDSEEDAEETEEEDLSGSVEEVGDDYVIVDGTELAVNEETELSGLSDLSELEVGTTVEVSFTLQEDGSRIASTLKVDDGDDEQTAGEGEDEGETSSQDG